jgi:hypothetical protein
MTVAEAHPAIQILLDLIDRAYDRKSWHGPNLRGAIRGLDAARASWRPGPGRHCIAEQVTHAAYWKYAARRVLRGDKRGSFPLRGSNWFPAPARLTPAEWREYTRLLDAEHKELRAAVAELSPEGLSRVPGEGKFTRQALVQGVAAHDLYHAGQIQLLKRLQADG